MKRVPPTRAQKERVMTASRFTYRMELVLEFDRPVSFARSREVARRILDSVEMAPIEVEGPEAFGEAALKCSELRRLIQLPVSRREE